MDFNPDRSLRIPRSFLSDKNYKNMPSEATLHMIPYAFSRLPTTVPHVRQSLNDARKMGVSRNSLSKNFLRLTLEARQQSALQL